MPPYCRCLKRAAIIIPTGAGITTAHYYAQEHTTLSYDAITNPDAKLFESDPALSVGIVGKVAIANLSPPILSSDLNDRASLHA